MKIAVTFSTLSGNTSVVAQNLAAYLEKQNHQVSLIDLMTADPDSLKEYELVFFGGSTYGEGGLNPISEMFFSLADSQDHNCNNTQFAFFSLGDSSYPNFSLSGQISSEKIDSMHGCVLKPIHQIDGYPTEEELERTRNWADNILKQLS